PGDQRLWPVTPHVRLERQIDGPNNHAVEHSRADHKNECSDRSLESPEVPAAKPKNNLHAEDKGGEAQRAVAVSSALNQVASRKQRRPHAQHYEKDGQERKVHLHIEKIPVMASTAVSSKGRSG